MRGELSEVRFAGVTYKAADRTFARDDGTAWELRSQSAEVLVLLARNAGGIVKKRNADNASLAKFECH